MAPIIPSRPGKGRPQGDTGLLGTFGTKFFEMLYNLVTGAAGPLGAISSILANAATLLGMKWDQVNAHEEDLGILQVKTQKLEGVIGYGCAYVSDSTQLPGTSELVLDFDTQVGPMVGCTLSAGTYTLGSKGLWRADAQAFYSWIAFASADCFLDIVVLTPAGSTFARRSARISVANYVTMTNIFSFVVPAAGYKVQARARVGAGTREILGGYQNTGFNVTKISDETS